MPNIILVKAAKATLAIVGAATAAEYHKAWARCAERLAFAADQARPKPRVFEVFHQQDHAQELFLAALVAGKSPSECEQATQEPTHA